MILYLLTILLEMEMDCAVKYIVGRADEDRYTITTLTNEIKMYAVYDGHSGKTVVNYIQDHLAEKFNVALIGVDFNDEEVMKKIITDVFLEIDAEMESNWRDFQSGTTANVVLRKGKKLYVANLADSRAIIFNSDGKILLETVDHDKQNQSEINRILALNAEIMYGNEDHPLSRFNLVPTRGFGDFPYKISIDSEESYYEDIERYNPRGFVSVIPDIYVFDVDDVDLKLLIASDGLWDGIYKNTTKVVEMILSLPQDDLTTLCTVILEKGRENYGCNSIYSKDDITVILVPL